MNWLVNGQKQSSKNPTLTCSFSHTFKCKSRHPSLSYNKIQILLLLLPSHNHCLSLWRVSESKKKPHFTFFFFIILLFSSFTCLLNHSIQHEALDFIIIILFINPIIFILPQFGPIFVQLQKCHCRVSHSHLEKDSLLWRPSNTPIRPNQRTWLNAKDEWQSSRIQD